MPIDPTTLEDHELLRRYGLAVNDLLDDRDRSNETYEKVKAYQEEILRRMKKD
jgi:hypothetical protein